MNIKEMCNLLAKKYPEEEFGFSVQIRIYDDGSGTITKHAFETRDEDENSLFDFNSIEELESHLKTKMLKKI